MSQDHPTSSHPPAGSADGSLAVARAATPDQRAATAGSLDHLRPPSGRPQDLLPGHRLVRVTGGDDWLKAEAFVYEMYVKIGYTDPSPRHRVEELAQFADRSIFNVVMDEDDNVIGTIRNIYGSYDHLPVNQFDRTDHADPDPVCELSSLVVDPTQRSTGVIEHLYRAGWRDAWRSGSSALVALIDDWLFDVFKDTYRLPFRRIGVGQHYMGTEPVPVALPLVAPAYLDHVRENPHFWAWILEGILPSEVNDWSLPIVLVDPSMASRGPAGRDEGIEPPRRFPIGPDLSR
jgi:hypothetical protein